MKNEKMRKIICYCIIALGVIGMAVFEFGAGFFSSRFVYGEWMSKTFSRLFGGIVCLTLISILASPHIVFGYRKGALKRLAVVLPCFAVAINNFPFLSLGGISFSADVFQVFLYGVFCFSVGLFEETAFRGCVFTVILGRVKPTRWGVLLASFISSALFGLVHIINIFAGASIGGVILQIGYSCLIGALCSIVLIKTANIWYCVILHAVYNFAGGVSTEFGEGKIWTAPTVMLTAVVAVIVTVYTVVLWYRLKKEEIEYAAFGRL